MSKLTPVDLDKASVEELEDCQKALLYDHEVADWYTSNLMVSDKTPRGKLIDILDQLICYRHMGG